MKIATMRHLIFRLSPLLLVTAWAATSAESQNRAARYAAANNMNPMDHGPFVSSTITLDPWSVRGIIVHKGIAVKVGPAGVRCPATVR